MDCQKIGNIILKLRKEKNMTQKQLSEKLNISDRTVSKWERGLGCPDISLLIPLAKELEIDVYELLGGESMEKESQIKANKVIENTINISNNKLKRFNLIYKLIMTICILIILVITSFWLIIKFHHMILFRPENVKITKLIDYEKLLSDNNCILNLTDQYCEFNDGKSTAISSIEYKVGLPRWYANGSFYGFDKNPDLNKMSMKFNDKDINEQRVNSYRIFDKNYTKKSMIVTSLTYFIFVEDLEIIEFDFQDNKYLIKKDYIEKVFENKNIKIDELLKNDNWTKHVIENLTDENFVKEFLNI